MTQLTQPDIRPVKESGQLYELATVYTAKLPTGNIIKIPAGFRYDGATSSQFLFQRDGIHRAAALVHDFLYEKKGKVGNLRFSRKDVDKIFKSMLKQYGVKSWHVSVSYVVVRAVGWVWWND